MKIAENGGLYEIIAGKICPFERATARPTGFTPGKVPESDGSAESDKRGSAEAERDGRQAGSPAETNDGTPYDELCSEDVSDAELLDIITFEEALELLK